MREPLGELRPYLVQILHPLGEIEGTGFLFHPEGYALTCWHVMESWGQLNRTKGTVRFGNQERDAEWLIDKSDQTADLALLKLTLPDGQKTPYLPLDIHWRVQTPDQLESFGYPKGQFGQQGIATAPKLQGLTPTQVNGIIVYPLRGLNLDNIDSGYSGAPVVNRTTQKVIGLVHAKQHKTQAFLIPLKPLFTKWPELGTLHDVFEQIRQRLGQLAEQALKQKLHVTPFIPLKLEAGYVKKEQPEDRGGRGTQAGDHGRNWEDFSLEKLLPPNGKFILSADVGTGKTTYLQWLASELVRRTDRMAIVMTCEELERLGTQDPKEILARWAGCLQDEFSENDLNQVLAEATSSKKLVFFFDGLDQIRGEDPSNIVKLAFSVAGQNPVLITSRPSAINRFLERDEQIRLLRLKFFSRTDQQQYFGVYFQTARAVCALAPNLTQVPMLAYMVRELVTKGRLKVSATRTELYEEFLDHVLTEHDANVRLQYKPGLIGKVEPVLGKLAFDALAQVEPHIQRVPTTVYTEEASVPLRDLIAFGLVNHLIGRGNESLFFTHQSFQEFLAAKYAADHPECIDKILIERWNPKWAEVIRFLAGLLGESLVKRILDDPDNVIHSNLLLAARCAGETKTLGANLKTDLVEKLIRLSDMAPFRADTIGALGAMGRWLEKDQIQCLINMLRDEEPDVREATIAALGHLGAQLDTEALTILVRLLRDNDPDLVGTSIQLIEHLRDQLDATTVARIAKLMDDNEPGVRQAAIAALGHLGAQLDAEALTVLIRLLRDNDPGVRENARAALGNLGDRLDATIFASIANLTDDNDPEVRWTAIKALEKIGDRLDATTVARIVKLMDDNEPGVREAAVLALGRLNAQLEATTVARIAKLMDDNEPSMRGAAVVALGRLDVQLEATTVARIVKLTGDNARSVRASAIEALGRLSAQLDTEALTVLVSLLRDNDPAGRYLAVEALGKLNGRLDAATVARIVNLLVDNAEVVRGAVVGALKQLRHQLDATTIVGIVKLMDDNDPARRLEAVRALGTLAWLGAQLGATTIARIAKLMDDNDPAGRYLAVEALGQLNAQLDATTIARIAKLMDDNEPQVRLEAVLALWRLGVQLDAMTVARIVKLVDDNDPDVGGVAVMVLGEYGRLDAQALNKLGKLVSGKEHATDAYNALETLYRAGIALPTITQSTVRQRSIKVAKPKARPKRGRDQPRKKRAQ